MNAPIYLLDSNVLIHDPQALFSFEEAIVGIPILVLEELDRFKGEATQRGRNTRQTIRYLDLLRERGSLAEGVKLDNGGILRVFFIPHDAPCQTPFNLSQKDADNGILLTALCLKQKGFTVKFVSKDLNARVKADVIGLESLDYTKDSIVKEELYKGAITLSVPSIQLKKDRPEELLDLVEKNDLVPHEFVILQSQNNAYNNAIFRYLGEKQFKRVTQPEFSWPFQARNPEQLMALDLLLDPTVSCVTLLGPAGTGKTFLVLLAALHSTLIKHQYEKILISRPVVPLGPDIGYLPGDMQEKLHSWMQPIYDTMDFISHTINASQRTARTENQNKYKKGQEKQEKSRSLVLEELIRQGKISLEAITYMRGRSVPYQYIFIDEVQNLTPHEVKTIVSRVGEGSKIVLAGDPYQIDSPYLDFNSNGLVVATNRLKGQAICGSVFLKTSERSELSRIAGELL